MTGMDPKVRGAHTTPPDIVDVIVQKTLGRLCAGLPMDQALGLRILDPSCGDGAFLRGACTYLSERYPTAHRSRILDCLYGVDVDAESLHAARRVLPTANLICADSLLDLDWARVFPDVMRNGGFDAVIGNPPWVSLNGRFGVRAYSESEIARLRDRYGGTSYMPNLFEYFIGLGLEITRPGGYLSFIVPDRLAYNRQYRDLRRSLLARAELLDVVHGLPFPDVVADAMIFVFRRCSPSTHSAVHICVHGDTSVRRLQSDLLAAPECRFEFPPGADVTRIAEQMESAGGPRLGDVCHTVSGFGGKSWLITKERLSDTQVPVLKGRSIDRYVVREHYWFEFRRENLTGRTSDRSKLGASPKILIRKTGDQLVAAWDDSGAYPEQSLYFIHENQSGLDLLFLLGVLNSRLVNVYYRARCLTNRRSFPQVKKLDLDSIPLPPVDLHNPEHRKRHDRIVGLVRQIQRAPEKPSRGQLEAEIEDVVSELYGLRAAPPHALLTLHDVLPGV